LARVELNYSPIEKVCLALIFDLRMLRHNIHAHTVLVIPKANLIKYILSRPILIGRLAKWAVVLEQYDLIYVPQKAIKGRAVADFLADHPIPSDWELNDNRLCHRHSSTMGDVLWWYGTTRWSLQQS